MTSPLKALADLAYARRLDASPDVLMGSFRIDHEWQETVTVAQVDELAGNYSAAKVEKFL